MAITVKTFEVGARPGREFGSYEIVDADSEASAELSTLASRYGKLVSMQKDLICDWGGGARRYRITVTFVKD